MSLLLGRGTAAIGACARRGILRAAPATTPMPMMAMGAAAPAAIPLLMSVRAFGKKKKKREGLHKEVKHDAKAERRNKQRKKHESRVKQLELVERARYAELEAEGGGKPPVIGLCIEKGPDSWDCWEPTGLLRRWRIATVNAALAKIVKQNSHLEKHMAQKRAEVGVRRGGDQLKDEKWLTSMQYQSRLDWTAAINDFVSVVSVVIIQWGEYGRGDSMLPTMVPGVSNCVLMPMTPSMVKNVKRGQVVEFLWHTKRQLATTPKSFRHISIVGKRVAALEGDVVQFEGKPFTVPKDHFWALGDNPAESTDSRHYGAIPLQNIRGRVLFTFQFDPFGFKSVAK